MKRKVFAIMEGEELPDGRILEIGSLYVDSETVRIPVTWAHDGTSPHPIGWASNFQRIVHRDHGDLSMEIVMANTDYQDALDHFNVYPFATDVEEEVWQTEPKILKKVHKARIRTLQLVPIQGIPFGMTKYLRSHDV